MMQKIFWQNVGLVVKIKFRNLIYIKAWELEINILVYVSNVRKFCPAAFKHHPLERLLLDFATDGLYKLHFCIHVDRRCFNL